MTFKGGKMFVVLTALSTLGGTAWGAFEFYNDYRNMKETIESYVAPDMSGIEQTLAVQQEEMSSLRTLVDALDVKVDNTEDSLSEDMDKVEDLARKVDDKTAETQREVRDDVYAMEQKLNERVRTLDGDLRTLRKDLEEKIQIILDNPLNDQ
jgi:chromosome segregation ATPase